MSDTPLTHIVIFTLKDSSSENRQALVASCNKYLGTAPGILYYSVGERGPEFDRPVNDQEYDVALHVVFSSKETHDSYQVSQNHLDFIAANSETWQQVRVMDSYISS